MWLRKTILRGSRTLLLSLSLSWVAWGAALGEDSDLRPRPEPDEGKPACRTTFRVETFAGPSPDGIKGEAGYQDGVGTAARFHSPTGAVSRYEDRGGELVNFLYVTDTGNHVIRKIEIRDRDMSYRALAEVAQVSTLAGQPGVPGFWDTESGGGVAQFQQPTGLAIDAQGNLYVADTGNHAIRQIDLKGNVTTLAGGGSAGYWDDTQGIAARFATPKGVAYGKLRGEPVVFVADAGNHCIRAVRLSGADYSVFTVAGHCTQAGYGDGWAQDAYFSSPGRIDWWKGLLFVADEGNRAVRLLRPDGESFRVSTIVGGNQSADPQALSTYSVLADEDMNLFITNGNTIAWIEYIRGLNQYADHATWVAGDGGQGYQNGCSEGAQFNAPLGVTPYFGMVMVADTDNHTIRILREKTPQDDMSPEGNKPRCPRCGPRPPIEGGREPN